MNDESTPYGDDRNLPPIAATDLPHDPWVLAGWWSDRQVWGICGQRTAREELAELAIVSELVRWTLGWLPLLIHQAYLAGASVDQVLTASGMPQQEMLACWLDWSSEQRRLYDQTGGEKGMEPAEAEHVFDVMEIGTGGGSIPGLE